MVRINPGPVKLSLFVYLISHIFAQGNYILLILYSRGPQVNTIFWDFPLDIETWTWPRTFPTFHPFHRSTAHTNRCRIEIIIIIIKKKTPATHLNTNDWHDHVFFNLSHRIVITQCCQCFSIEYSLIFWEKNKQQVLNNIHLLQEIFQSIF